MKNILNKDRLNKNNYSYSPKKDRSPIIAGGMLEEACCLYLGFISIVNGITLNNYHIDFLKLDLSKIPEFFANELMHINLLSILSFIQIIFGLTIVISGFLPKNKVLLRSLIFIFSGFILSIIWIIYAVILYITDFTSLAFSFMWISLTNAIFYLILMSIGLISFYNYYIIIKENNRSKKDGK